MSDIIQIIVTIVCSVLASSGLWSFIQARREKKDAKMQMILGLGHDRIVNQGMIFIKRGWLTQDEYENLHDYLYVPYEKMGGNGSAKKIMAEVERLPIKPISYNSGSGQI